MVLEDASDSAKSYFLDQGFHPKLDGSTSDKALETMFL